MTYLNVELLNDHQILNINDLLIDLEFALYTKEPVTLMFPYGSVVVEPIQYEKRYLLIIKSIKNHTDRSKEVFFEHIMQPLFFLVEALNDALVLDEDIELGIAGDRDKDIFSLCGAVS